MNENESSNTSKEFVLKELELISIAFEKNESMVLRRKSNELIRKAVQENNKALVKIALVAYCLHKILSKSHFVQHKDWPVQKKKLLNSIKKINSEKDLSFLTKKLDSLGKKIQEFDEKFSSYVENLIEKSKVKYAAEAFYLGMSLSKAAEFTDTNVKSLQIYLSKTKQFDENLKEKSINERIKKLESVLK